MRKHPQMFCNGNTKQPSGLLLGKFEGRSMNVIKSSSTNFIPTAATTAASTLNAAAAIAAVDKCTVNPLFKNNPTAAAVAATPTSYQNKCPSEE